MSRGEALVKCTHQVIEVQAQRTEAEIHDTYEVRID